MRRKGKWNGGDIIEVALPGPSWAYGKIIREFVIAFFNARKAQRIDPSSLAGTPYLFTAYVAVKLNVPAGFPVVGHIPVTPADPREVWGLEWTKEGVYYRANDRSERLPASEEDIATLYPLVVFRKEHVVERLVDEFEGRTYAKKFAYMLPPRSS